ncbi:MAG: hypothetical protein GDA49_13420 [Rhodospirillales bacterium]|nr:hypothetical protein [Rhodospirillales bacterium]
MIQSVINRMAMNSFLLKGWSVTLLSALFALAAADGHPSFVLLAFIPIPVLMFWVLDGYFLLQERLYRALYDHVRQRDDGSIDFSMDAARFKDREKRRWCAAMRSTTLVLFHGVLFLLVCLSTMLAAWSIMEE